MMSSRRPRVTLAALSAFSCQCFFFLAAFLGTHYGSALRTPLTVSLQRQWRIPANKAIGSLIDRARIDRGVDLSKVTFELGSSIHQDGSDFFRIDSRTGNIYLDEPLTDHVGERFFLFIKASTDDRPTSSVEVMVEVEPADEFANGSGPDGNPLLPQPGFENRPFPPVSRPTIPLNFNTDDDTDEDLTDGDLMSITANDTKPTKKKQKGKDPLFVARPDQIPSVKPTRVPVIKVPSNRRTTTTRTTPTPTASSTSTAAPENETEGVDIIPSLPPVVKSAGTSTLEATNMPSNGTDQPPNVDLTLTIVPIIVVVGAAPLVGLVVWMLRRRYTMKKENADTSVRFKTSVSAPPAKKEVTGELNSVDTMDEGSRGDSSISTSPSGLLNWHRALSNRYESTGPGEDLKEGEDEENKWEFPRHHLRILGILGEGCFGQVWKCEALNVAGVEGTTTVAVKTLKENAGEREKRDLLSELEVMKKLDPHPNVVTLLGCCTIKEPIFVILEYIQHGKLQSYLRASRAEHYYGNLHGKSSHLTSRDLTSFAFQVAKGMDYLTSRGIIHRDLAARNVLVGEKNLCKVADFGFARDLLGTGVYERKSEGRLPIRWMAPESLYDNVFTSKTDVWSFGILMWEIVTLGSTPYPGMAAGEVMRKVRDGYRLEKPDHCRREIYNIMYYCWDRDPKERPSFTKLTHLLDQLLMSETDYIELDRYPDHAYYNIISNMSGEKL